MKLAIKASIMAFIGLISIAVLHSLAEITTREDAIQTIAPGLELKVVHVDTDYGKPNGDWLKPNVHYKFRSTKGKAGNVKVDAKKSRLDNCRVVWSEAFVSDSGDWSEPGIEIDANGAETWSCNLAYTWEWFKGSDSANDSDKPSDKEVKRKQSSSYQSVDAANEPMDKEAKKERHEKITAQEITVKCEAPDGGIKLDGGNLNVLKKGEELSVEVKPVGSTVALWSCGWPQGCKWLSYTVFPGQHWKIIVKQSPQIVMERER